MLGNLEGSFLEFIVRLTEDRSNKSRSSGLIPHYVSLVFGIQLEVLAFAKPCSFVSAMMVNPIGFGKYHKGLSESCSRSAVKRLA
jgi:hypothetical protein